MVWFIWGIIFVICCCAFYFIGKADGYFIGKETGKEEGRVEGLEMALSVAQSSNPYRKQSEGKGKLYDYHS